MKWFVIFTIGFLANNANAITPEDIKESNSYKDCLMQLKEKKKLCRTIAYYQLKEK